MIMDRLDPWYSGGQSANQAMLNMLGLGAGPMIGGTAPQIETFTTQGAYTPNERVAKEFGGPGRSDLAYNRDLGGSYGPSTTGYRVNGQTFSTLEEAQAFANANRTGGTEWSWQTDPGYQFRLGQGLGAIDASAAARGGLYSGAAMQDALKFGQDYGSAEFGNVFCQIRRNRNLDRT